MNQRHGERRSEEEGPYVQQPLNFNGFSGGLGSGFSANYESLAASADPAASAGIASLGLGMHSLGTMDSDSIFSATAQTSAGLPVPQGSLGTSSAAPALAPLHSLTPAALPPPSEPTWPQPFDSADAMHNKPNSSSADHYQGSATSSSASCGGSAASHDVVFTEDADNKTRLSAQRSRWAAQHRNHRNNNASVSSSRGRSSDGAQDVRPVKAQLSAGSRLNQSKRPPQSSQRVPRKAKDEGPKTTPESTKSSKSSGTVSVAQEHLAAQPPHQVWHKASAIVQSSARKSSACARRARGMWRALQFARMYDVLWHCALVLCLMPVSLAWSLLTFVRSSNVPTAATPQASIWAARRAFLSQVAVVVYLVHLVLHCSQQTREWLAHAAHSNAKHLTVDWQPQQLLGVDRLNLPAAGFSPLEYVQQGLSLLGDALPLQAALLSGAIVWDHATHTWLSYRPLQRELVNLVLSGVCVGLCCLYSRSAWLCGVALPMLLVSALRSGRLVDKPRAAATHTPVTLSSLELLAIAFVFFFCWGAQ